MYLDRSHLEALRADPQLETLWVHESEHTPVYTHMHAVVHAVHPAHPCMCACVCAGMQVHESEQRVVYTPLHATTYLYVGRKVVTG